MKKGQTYGNGSITKDSKNNRWVGKYDLGKGPDGKRKRKTVYGKTKNEVKIKLEQIRLDIHTGDFVDASQITIKQIGEQMLESKRSLGKIKDSTYFRSLETLKRLATIYNTPIQSCNALQIQNFLLGESNFSQSVINKECIMLNGIFKYAIKHKIIANNIMEDVERPHLTQKKIKVRGLTVDERKKFVAAVRNNEIRYSQQMLLSLFTGMRMGEINALRVSDINFTFNTIVISQTISVDANGRAVINETTKTAAGMRKIPLTNEARKILVKAIGDKTSGLIFSKENGSMIPTGNVLCQFKRMQEKYKFIDETVDGKVDLHSLRHTYATTCIEAGMKPVVLQKLMGHADISVTMNTYADVFEQHQDNELAKVTEYMKEIGISDGEEYKEEIRDITA